jgi:hypothetical protein
VAAPVNWGVLRAWSGPALPGKLLRLQGQCTLIVVYDVLAEVCLTNTYWLEEQWGVFWLKVQWGFLGVDQVVCQMATGVFHGWE